MSWQQLGGLAGKVQKVEVSPGGHKFDHLEHLEFSAVQFDQVTDSRSFLQVENRTWVAAVGNYNTDFIHGHCLPLNDVVEVALTQAERKVCGNVPDDNIPDMPVGFT